MQKNKVLIVDDVLKNIQILASLLSMNGYETEFADNGTDALNWLKSYSFDIILLDVMMPEMNGFQVCQKFREFNKTTPVIFLTAKNDKESIITGFNAGGQDYITKPFIKEELLARIDCHIKLKQYSDNLNQMVEDKTAQLKNTIKQLKSEIDARKTAEQKLQQKNFALQEIMGFIEQRKDRCRSKMEAEVIPVLKNFQTRNPKDKHIIDNVITAIECLHSPVGENSSDAIKKILSVQEFEICKFIKSGMQSKEIAKIMNLSSQTIKWHRQNIRNKLNIDEKKINLAEYLKDKI